MQKLITILLLILSLSSFGQGEQTNPLKLIVLQPDTAIIEQSLHKDINCIEATQRSRYYDLLKQNENALSSCKGCDSLVNGQLRQELAKMKSLEPHIKAFKYYQLLSFYSVFYYTVYFNETRPISTIIELPNQKTDLQSLKKLADSTNTDFIIFFNDVHTAKRDDAPVLRLKTSLYSKKENKIIGTKETEGENKPFGTRWDWSCTETLSKLLINAVKTSTGAIVQMIER